MEMREILENVVKGRDLTENQAKTVMDSVMSGGATDSQIAGLLIAMRMKGESEEEVTGFARSMRGKAVQLEVENNCLIDTCGTGGDGIGTFNISTISAFVVAAGGVPVAKHGNRSVSSKCGSADLLEELGVNILLENSVVTKAIDEIGIGFMFAPNFHQAMKHAMVPRKELGIRTVFNILGPLTNPAGAKIQVLGVFRPDLTELLAKVLKRLGSSTAFVVHGDGGIDEVSISGPTRVSLLKNGEVDTFNFVPEDVGIRRAPIDSIVGGDRLKNAAITRSVLAGEKGPARDIVLLNSSFALVAAERAKDFKTGVEMAAELIDSGLAAKKLQQLIELTRSSVA